MAKKIASSVRWAALGCAGVLTGIVAADPGPIGAMPSTLPVHVMPNAPMYIRPALAQLAQAKEVGPLAPRNPAAGTGEVPLWSNLGTLAYPVSTSDPRAQSYFDQGAAVAQFEQAAAIEDTLPYMEPAYWYYPVRQSLGAALLRAGKPEAAEAAFKASLKKTPQNAWALYGLAETHKARGDNLAADAAMNSVGRGWIGDRKLLSLDRL